MLLNISVSKDASNHGLRTPYEEIAFTARTKIHSHSQIFSYGQSIFCLPNRPNFSDIFDLCLHWLSVVCGPIGVGTFFRTIGVDNILPGIFATSFHLLLSIIFLLITSYALRRFSIQFPYCSLRGYTFTIANWRKNHELMSGPRRPPPPRNCCHRLFSSKHR